MKRLLTLAKSNVGKRSGECGKKPHKDWGQTKLASLRDKRASQRGLSLL